MRDDHRLRARSQLRDDDKLRDDHNLRLRSQLRVCGPEQGNEIWTIFIDKKSDSAFKRG